MDVWRPVRARRRVLAAVALALLGASIASRGLAAASRCDRVRALTLPDARIDATDAIDAYSAPFYVPVAFCRVRLTIAPTRDSDIRTEVWLPLDTWNGNFQAVGNSDAAGAISYDDMVDAVSRGFATSSTDTGHVGNTLAFAVDHRQRYIDFGYRAVHEMTVRAKAIVQAFYGRPATHAYWNGCSQGGRQGLTEAMRFPTDYDGIIAGAPALAHMRLHAERLALNVFVNRTADSYIPAAKYPAIHRAALDACDAADGASDGLIANPLACRFDPAVLECRDGDRDSCLTAEQVGTARGLFGPLIDPSSGRQISPPLLQPGSELGWARIAGPEPIVNAIDAFKYVVFKDARWSWRSFRLSSDLPRALRADGGVINRTSPDLQPFFDAGGKMLLYHGWADPQVPPLATVGYFNEVVRQTGDQRRGTAIELYLEPGVAHCSGGDGPDRFDAIGALDEWVRSGRAPARIIASHVAGRRVDRTRPLCPYPQVATYVAGSVDRAENFRCAAPTPPATGKGR
jgi:feruloyl esterase